MLFDNYFPMEDLWDMNYFLNNLCVCVYLQL
jgi:hypothetical protein